MPSLQVPGGELSYEVAGEGTPVVLVHGLVLDSRIPRSTSSCRHMVNMEAQDTVNALLREVLATLDK